MRQTYNLGWGNHLSLSIIVFKLVCALLQSTRGRRDDHEGSQDDLRLNETHLVAIECNSIVTTTNCVEVAVVLFDMHRDVGAQLDVMGARCVGVGLMS